MEKPMVKLSIGFLHRTPNLKPRIRQKGVFSINARHSLQTGDFP
jgi:hypothetical protein